MGTFGESVDYNPNEILATKCLRQTYNKVHGNLIQYPFWNAEGLERSRRSSMFGFYMLTYMALGHIFNNILLHVAPP